MAQGSGDRDVLAWCSGDGGLVVPIVVHGSLAAAGEDAVDGCGALGEDGGDEDGGAEEELTVCGREGGVVWEFPCQGAHDGGAGVVREVEEGVHVWEKLVADVHRCLAGVDDGGPYVGFLGVGG